MRMFSPPKPQDGQYWEIHHKDSNKHNNDISNLMFITRREHGKSEHKIAQLRKHHKSSSHRGEVLKGEKDGETRYWENGPTAARDIGCTSVLVYNATNKKQSARRAYGWELAWIKRDDVPKGAIIQAKRKRSRRAW